jgi:hypothetical protein
MNWQPIETAPLKHGFAALLYVPGINDWRRPSGLPYMVVGVWDEKRIIGGPRGVWRSDLAEIEGYGSTGDYIVHPPIHPTHWAPLPDPPTAVLSGAPGATRS